MNRILEATIPTALLALVFGAPAPAQEARFPPSPVKTLIESADADDDGVVTRAELAAIDVFAKLDTNQDGKLSDADVDQVFVFHAGRRGAFLLRAADEDQDGKLTRADWQSWITEIDADGDGVLQPEELRAILPPPPDAPEAPEPPAPPAPPSKAGASRVPAPPRGLAPLPPMPPHPLAPPEFSAADLGELFEELDANGDGLLEKSEMPPGLHIWQQKILAATTPRGTKTGG